MNILIFHPKAEQEYITSFRWYEEKQEGLGELFETVVEVIIKKITKHPQYYGYGRKPYREAIVGDFPFVVVYKHNEIKNEVYVVAIHHTKKSVKGKYRR